MKIGGNTGSIVSVGFSAHMGPTLTAKGDNTEVYTFFSGFLIREGA